MNAFDTYTNTIKEQSRMLTMQEKEIRQLKKALAICAVRCGDYYLKWRTPSLYKHADFHNACAHAKDMQDSGYWLEQSLNKGI